MKQLFTKLVSWCRDHLFFFVAVLVKLRLGKKEDKTPNKSENDEDVSDVGQEVQEEISDD